MLMSLVIFRTVFLVWDVDSWCHIIQHSTTTSGIATRAFQSNTASSSNYFWHTCMWFSKIHFTVHPTFNVQNSRFVVIEGTQANTQSCKYKNELFIPGTGLHRKCKISHHQNGFTENFFGSNDNEIFRVYAEGSFSWIHRTKIIKKQRTKDCVEKHVNSSWRLFVCVYRNIIESTRVVISATQQKTQWNLWLMTIAIKCLFLILTLVRRWVKVGRLELLVLNRLSVLERALA